MSSNAYTYHSRKREGFRRNITVGQRDLYQMKSIPNLKWTDLDKVERFAERNGCNVVVERIEKDCDGIGNITVWTSTRAFEDWQQEFDVLCDFSICEVCSLVANDTHKSIHVPIHGSLLPAYTFSNQTDPIALVFDPYNGEQRPITYLSELQDLGQHMLRNQGELGIFGFVFYLHKHREEQSSSQTANEPQSTTKKKRKRTLRKRLTYNRPGEPQTTR